MDATTTQISPFPSSTVSLEGVPQAIFENIAENDWHTFVTTVGYWWDVYSIFALFISFLLFSGFVYAKIRYGELMEHEHKKLKEAEAAWAMRNSTSETKNGRWDIIEKRVTDPSPESWRIAIIEADILLEETLSNAGFTGQGIGEKLKRANPQTFTTLQDAWTAHKVRNEIAHVGSDFVLTQKVAKETIVQYERVFREFGVL